MENGKGEKTTPGSALVALPTLSKKEARFILIFLEASFLEILNEPCFRENKIKGGNNGKAGWESSGYHRGGRGIGKADALLFAKEGAAVIVSDIDEAPLMEVVKEIKAAGGKADGCAGDVTKLEDCQKVMDMAVEKFGKLDILVNNAGLTRDALIHKMTDAQWDICVDISLKGTFNCIRAASKYMMKKGIMAK